MLLGILNLTFIQLDFFVKTKFQAIDLLLHQLDLILVYPKRLLKSFTLLIRALSPFFTNHRLLTKVDHFIDHRSYSDIDPFEYGIDS